MTYQKYYFDKLSAKQMTDYVYAVPFVKVGNDVTYGKLDKYSVLEYAYNKRGDSNLSTLLTATLSYGAEAQEYFGYHTERLADAEYIRVTVEDGTLADDTASGLYTAGSVVALIPPTEDPDFMVSGWTVNGKMLVANQFTVPAEGSCVVRWADYYTFAPSDDEKSYTLASAASGVTAAGNMKIPSEYNGKPVTAIGNQAFYRQNGITGVTIPDSIGSIGTEAFERCENLTKMTIENDNISIGSWAFFKCPIQTATIPTCTSDAIPKDTLKTLVINGGTSIGDMEFFGSTNLTDLKIGDSVTSIGERAFRNCTSLTNLEIGSNVTSIGEKAFMDCTSLTKLEIGSNVTSIGTFAFEFSPIQTATIPTAAIEVIPKENLQTLVINGGDSIGNDAFFSCHNLTSVTIGDSVTSIGMSAFESCENLTSVTIGDSVTSIDMSAFVGCDMIETATIPTCALGIIRGPRLKTLVIRGGTTIGDSAFKEYQRLTSVTIGDSVTHIGIYAFKQSKQPAIQMEVTFENPYGWWVSTDPEATSGENIDSADLAGTYEGTLKANNYYNYYWNRNTQQ